MIEGSPKYLLCLESCIGLRIFKMHSLLSCEVFGLKKSEDLSVFIFWLEDVNKILAFLDLCFAKKEAIIGEEEVSKERAAPANSNSIYLLVRSSFMNEC